jgi:phosphatidylinositol dimannoside acyltransferase
LADGTLEAPHRRAEAGSRSLERFAVVVFRTVGWIVAHVPPGIPRALIARGAQLSYPLWPTKRRWSNANFSHVLGLPPGDRRVRLTALAAYAEYARYVVETMRLPHLKPELASGLIHQADFERIEPIWKGTPGGVIFALGHIGNADAVAAGVASHGWPISVLADDSSFPEMFEEFRRTREQWGVHVIPWRNLREIYGVLRREEMLALLVDWGYRADGIPVRLFDAWTTLPAGPATLAAKTGAKIIPVAIRRMPDDRTFTIRVSDPITVSSSAPASIQAATQLLADDLQRSIAAAPEQWYSFKPLWPLDKGASAELEARAAQMAAQTTARRAEPVAT